MKAVSYTTNKKKPRKTPGYTVQHTYILGKFSYKIYLLREFLKYDLTILFSVNLYGFPDFFQIFIFQMFTAFLQKIDFEFLKYNMIISISGIYLVSLYFSGFLQIFRFQKLQIINYEFL